MLRKLWEAVWLPLFILCGGFTEIYALSLKTPYREEVMSIPLVVLGLIVLLRITTPHPDECGEGDADPDLDPTLR